MTAGTDLQNVPLFVYGSLVEPEVLMVLLGRVPKGEDAVAPDFTTLEFPSKPYPVLVKEPGAATSGRLLVDLTPKESELLDAFEHPIYVVCPVTVDVEAGSLLARAYVVSAEKANEIGAAEPWQRSLLLEALPQYLDACARFRRNYR